MSIYWIIAIVFYVIISAQVMYNQSLKSSGFSDLEERNKVLLNDVKKAQSESDSLKRQLEQEKMSRRVDTVATKMKSHFDDILSEVTEEASIALNAMAEDVKDVRTKNVTYVKPLVTNDEASIHMQVKRKKVPANLAENLA